MTSLKWRVTYGMYAARGEQYNYAVSKQVVDGRFAWVALYRPVEQDSGPWDTVPGTLPLDRREACRNAEKHHQGVLLAYAPE